MAGTRRAERSRCRTVTAYSITKSAGTQHDGQTAVRALQRDTQPLQSAPGQRDRSLVARRFSCIRESLLTANAVTDEDFERDRATLVDAQRPAVRRSCGRLNPGRSSSSTRRTGCQDARLLPLNDINYVLFFRRKKRAPGVQPALRAARRPPGSCHEQSAPAPQSRGARATHSKAIPSRRP